jgi:hypothetical protein
VGFGVQAYVTILALLSARHREVARAQAYGAVAAAIVLLEAAVLSVPQLRASLVRAALEPLPWYNSAEGSSWVHHWHLAEIYGWVWYLVIPATCVVISRRFRPGLFVSLMFWLPFLGVAIVVATKHPRYTVQFLPLAWLIIGGATEVLWPHVSQSLHVTMLAPLRKRPVIAMIAGVGVVMAFYGFLRVTPSLPAAVRRPWQRTGVFTTGTVYDWRGTARELGPVIAPDALVVSDMSNECRYYLQRDAYQLLGAHEQIGAGDWETPNRDSSQKIQTADHLQQMRQRRPVWILASKTRWRSGREYSPDLTRYVEGTCRLLGPTAAESFAVVFECRPRAVEG